MKQFVKKAVGRVLSYGPKSLQTGFKELNELLFWRLNTEKGDQKFYNAHMEHAFTGHFAIEREYYRGKRILDVGCGPVGTLEWADDALERVGVDPLADKYMKLIGGTQKMSYVNSGSEDMPFDDGHFDVVTTFNSLDHVEDLDRSIAELKRVCKPGGDLLIIVEVNHEPTITEPHDISSDFVDRFPEFEVVSQNICAIRDDHDVYASLADNVPLENPDDEGIVSLHLRKRG